MSAVRGKVWNIKVFFTFNILFVISLFQGSTHSFTYMAAIIITILRNPYYGTHKTGTDIQTDIQTHSGLYRVAAQLRDESFPGLEMKITYKKYSTYKKVEYLSNHLLDHTQILNLSLGDKSKILNFLK